MHWVIARLASTHPRHKLQHNKVFYKISTIGQFLANAFNNKNFDAEFKYSHQGSLAYIGANEAIGILNMN
jgi:hypothetical protein